MVDSKYEYEYTYTYSYKPKKSQETNFKKIVLSRDTWRSSKVLAAVLAAKNFLQVFYWVPDQERLLKEFIEID